MKRGMLGVLILAVFLAWTVNSAQARKGHGKSKMIQALDLNSDQIIDAREIASASISLKEMDVDNDGQLSREEFMEGEGRSRGRGSSRGQGRGMRGQGGEMRDAEDDMRGSGRGMKGHGRGSHDPGKRQGLMSCLDSNDDGVIDGSEIENAPQALLAMDQDGDGQLTEDEYSPGRKGEGRGRIKKGS